ncbi:MAG: HNH endonuclease [Deltaproteobacteria bacterium]|nr:HNH endonuclease [Deltaproteobacteria bacterium]
MKLWVGVTDNDWYRFLSRLLNVDEVNFWQPGGSSQFRGLRPGELFLFKLHSPENFIAGGGFFAHSSLLPVSLAWEAFGEKNGAATFEEMRSKIVQYRSARVAHEDFKIGCIILQHPFFLPQSDWIPVPSDFSLNIVQGKTYDLDSGTGKELWDAIQMRAQSRPTVQLQVGDGQVAWSNPALVRQRLGQGAFRILVTDTYQRRCAVTQEKALPALEAAHIRPVTQEGKHRVDNGLLLRSDIHKLFDAGYVTVTPDYKFRASRKLKDEFDNGEEYLRLQGSNIWLPRDPDCRPSREFLEWHSDTVYRK